MQVPHDRQASGTRDTLNTPSGTDEFIEDEVDDEESRRDEGELKVHCVVTGGGFDELEGFLVVDGVGMGIVRLL
jgi:hypothetical protein